MSKVDNRGPGVLKLKVDVHNYMTHDIHILTSIITGPPLYLSDLVLQHMKVATQH